MNFTLLPRTISTMMLLAGLPFMLIGQSMRPTDKAERIITEKFPATRFLDFEYEMQPAMHYNSKLYGEDYEKGKVKNINRAKLSLNYTVYKTAKFAITPHFRYRFESLTFDQVENRSTNYPIIYHDKTERFNYFSGTINTTYFSKLFNKPAVYSLNISADASHKDFEYMSASLAGILILKREAKRSMSVGLIVFLDKRMLIPAVPLFSYESQIAGSPWRFDAAIPRYVYFRRTVFTDGRLSLGLLNEGSHFYDEAKHHGLSYSYRIVRRELRTGVLYEHFINKHFILSARGGAAYNYTWKVTKKSSRDAIVKYDPKTNAYFNIGISYNL